VGTTRKRFSMQSLSKPFTYGLALADLGTAAADEKVDVEPSGDSFTESPLAPRTGRPANAEINAGALAGAAMRKGARGRSPAARWAATPGSSRTSDATATTTTPWPTC